MKVWGSHMAGMDHHQRRAEDHLQRRRDDKTSTASEASKMNKLSAAEQRKVDMEQRLNGKMLGPRNRRKTDR